MTSISILRQARLGTALAALALSLGTVAVATPAAAQGEIYWEDLTGLAVVNRKGVLLGEVLGIVAHGAHPLLRVASPGEAAGAERLIPYVPAIIDAVDVEAGRIDVDWGADY